MAAPGTTMNDITFVSSHPVASAQCRKFLHKELPDVPVRAANATAEAAAQAAEEPGLAAIGPALAAENYGLDILATDIADHVGNQTRFVLVGREGVPAPTGHDKTTVVLTQREDRPGSLVAILQQFAARSISLSRLSSRPVKQGLGNYCFIVDFEGHIADELTADCLRSIFAKHADVKFLGSYPTAGDGSMATRAEAEAAWAHAHDWMEALRDHIGNS
jgi:prephenate dehydratase